VSIRHEARGGLAERLPSGGGEQLDPVKFRAFADNVLVRLLPLPTQTASGLYTPPSDKRRVQESREAIVVASGPGYHNKAGRLVPNETRAGDRVLVPAQAGDIWHSALSAPRFNKTAEFRDLMGEEGEYRVVREQEILGVLSEAEAAE
jgi:co-chaperonin GroES (HSP10)